MTYASQWSCAGNWIGNLLAALPPGCRQDLGPAEVDPRSGVALIGAVPWVTNYNVALRSCDMAAARGIARSLSERGGGIAGVQAMALPHGQGESFQVITRYKTPVKFHKQRTRQCNSNMSCLEAGHISSHSHSISSHGRW